VRVVLTVLHVLSGLLGWLTIAVSLSLARRLGRGERPEAREPSAVPGAGPRPPAGGPCT
jgi:hypothetical protein